VATLDDILRRLASVRSGLLRIELQTRVLTFLALSSGLALVLILAEALFHFNAGLRTLMFIASVLIAIPATGWLIARPLLRFLHVLPGPSDTWLALFVGNSFPHVRDRLLNALQLRQLHEQGTSYSRDLIEASLRDVAASVRELDFTALIDASPLRTARKRALAVAGALALVFALLPSSALDATHRLMHFNREFVPPAQYILSVKPGNIEVVKGESVQVLVSVSSADESTLPDGRVSIFWRPEGQERVESQSLQADSANVFRTSLSGLRTSMEYFAQFADVQSARYRITVVDRPLLRSFRVRLTHPSYTGLPPVIQDEFAGNVSAVTGTSVRIEGLASKPLGRGALVFNSGEETSLDVHEERFSGTFRLLKDGAYRISVQDAEGRSNENPVAYSLTALPDQPPSVTIVEPGRNIDIAGSTALALRLRIADDYGFSDLKLGYRLVHSRYDPPQENPRFKPIPLPRPSGTSRESEVSYLWDFSDLGLVPEDVVEYFAEVTDNDAVTGPKSTRSATFLLRLPSLEEVFTDLDREHTTTIDELRHSAEEARELRRRIESLSDDFKKNKEMDWQQQKKLEETARKYQELQKKLDEVREKLDVMTEEMNRQNVLSPETMEKYLELQQLFEELNSSELQQALQRLQQAMQNVNKEQLLRALEQVTFSEERFRQSIERTLDLLKRIQIEQKLDEVRKRAEEISAEQQELEESTSDSTVRAEELARRQNDLRRKMDQLRTAAEDVQQRMEEFFTEMPEEELAAALKALDSMNVTAEMERAAAQLQSGQRSAATQTQKQINQSLERFANALMQIQKQMLENQQQYIVNALRRATRNLLELSAREEDLKARSQNAPPQSQQLRQNAQDQVEIVQDLQNVTAALQELARRSFAVTPDMAQAIGEAFRHMHNALNALDTRNAPSASMAQRQAMESLNKAAMAVQQSLQAMLQQGGGQGAGGLMQQLQTMAGQQMSINARTQAEGDAARLAVEQQALQKSLEQLNAEARASGEHQRILGDLERIGDEMKEVVRDLEQNNVNPETIRKQERILSRLLDASRSARERDFEKKRRSKPGQPVARPGPGDLDPETLEGRNRLREDFLRALEHGYSRDYKNLIKRYFEELQKADIDLK